MAKTGRIAAFALGEKQTAMVNLPTQFVTASDANKKGYQYSKLVDYAEDEKKVCETNNESMTEMIDLKEEFKHEGYANRTNAINEIEPIFSSDKLHYNNHDISILRKRLDSAQENGNNIHELAFSIRGDWLVKNNLYDPEAGTIDQDRLKHAQQDIAKILINKGFKLPLGEHENDVVWFGVIHQDTDHLNMHLWFAKESKETRPEMLKQKGRFKGQPIGVIPLETIEQAKREFRHQLMSSAERQKRTDVLKGLGQLKKEIVTTGSESLLNDKYAEQIKAIYNALPQEQKGRWQVGNTSTRSKSTKMSKANQLTNNLLDELFKNELGEEYQAFRDLGRQFDAFNIEDQGVMRKGQATLSENKDEELRKRLTNQLYRYFNQIEDTTITDIDDMLENVKKRQIEQKNWQDGGYNKKNQSAGLKEKITYPESKLALEGEKQLQARTSSQTFSLKGSSFNKISKLWRQDVRAESNAQRRFMQNQRKMAREEKIEEFEAENNRNR
ncbi:MobP2 family relaxase [Leuconostoc citreum]|uniref:MobP2 family relaxase n=1 Tax=Leuconostoc citreum TaxID=33964 RepID=UPI0032DFBBAF